MALTRLQHILAAVETILKLALMVLFLDLILLILFAAFLRAGIIQQQVSLFAGIAISADVFALLLWWKVHIASKQGKRWAAYCSVRNTALFFLLLWTLAVGVYLLNGFRTELYCRTVQELPAVLKSGIHPEQIVPNNASDICFREELLPFIPLTVKWTCSSTEDAFRKFALQNDWSLEKTQGNTLSYRRHARNGVGISVIFDPDSGIMQGQLNFK